LALHGLAGAFGGSVGGLDAEFSHLPGEGHGFIGNQASQFADERIVARTGIKGDQLAADPDDVLASLIVLIGEILDLIHPLALLRRDELGQHLGEGCLRRCLPAGE
jgi:hypothetical protein